MLLVTLNFNFNLGALFLLTAQLMRNTGSVFANEFQRERCRAIVGNLHRLGVTNCVVSNMDGRAFPKVRV